MPDQSDDPIDAIRREQENLRSRLDDLDARIRQLSTPSQAGASEAPDPLPATSSVTPGPTPPPPIPEALPAEPSRSEPSSSTTRRKPERVTSAAELEMRVGTVWLVRVGVVLLVSALVFGSKLAYSTFIADLPAAGKAALCYLFSVALIATGSLFERRQLLQNYGRVLTAGGLAAVYYTTYAIHHVDRLRIVEDPLVAGSLLLACGLAVLAFALFKRSHAMAIAAVSLAYYAGAISPLGGFAMFSNTLLTAIGITLLVRQRWVAVSFVCLGATYASFFFWQFIYPELGSELTPLAFTPTMAYLTGYWILFTAATVFTGAEGFAERQRLRFASVNTAAYFLLGTATIGRFASQTPPLDFWQFTLALGAAQTALSTLPRFAPGFRDRLTPLVSDVLLGSGLSCLTIAAFAKLDGHQLSLTLAAESALLLLVHLRHTDRVAHAPVLLAGSLITALLGAAVTAFQLVDPGTPAPLITAAATFLIPLAQAHFIRRDDDPGTSATLSSTIYILTALAIGATGLRPHLATDLQPPALLLAATALTFASSWRPLRLPELAPLSAAYSLSAALWFITAQLSGDAHFTLPVSAACLAAAFAILLWWHFAPPQKLAAPHRRTVDTVAAVTFSAMLATVLDGHLADGTNWQVTGGTTAVVLAALALAIRAWPLALVASLFHLLSLAAFLTHGTPDQSSLLGSFSPVLLLTAGAALLRLATSERGFAGHTGRGLEPADPAAIRRLARSVAAVSVALAAGTFLLWAVRFFPVYATVVVTVGGLVAFAAGVASRLRTARLAALAILAFALGRLLVVDVWGFATLVRFVAFFVIGAALVALGFVYNRFQETLRKYL